MSKVKYCCAGVSQKWVFAVMAFNAVLCAFAMRMCLSFTIPKMVKPAEQTHAHIKNQEDTCPGPNINMTINTTMLNKNDISDMGTYEWSEYTQGIILGSFYWGYVISHVPGGMLAEKFGGKHTLGLGLLSTAICTLLTPMAIQLGGALGLIVIRVIMGLCEGTTQPALSVMLAQWVPAGERSKISSFVFAGAIFGVLLISSGLGSILRLLSWPGVYYSVGSLGVVWYFFWTLLCYNNPREHPFISEVEARKLHAKLSEHTHADAPSVPWRHLLGSAPFWALVAITVGRDWGAYIILSDLPKYTMNVLKFTVEENGWFYIIFNMSYFVSSFLFSWMSDWLVKRKYLSRTNVRKVFVTVGSFGHACFIVISSYVGCEKLMYFVTMTLSMFFGGSAFANGKANVLDLSPNYAGSVMAISHGLAGICGIAGPYLVGVLVPNETLSEWRTVYWIIFIVYCVTNIIFIVFGSGDVQDWNNPSFDRKKSKNKTFELKEVQKLLTVDKIQIVATGDINKKENIEDTPSI